MRLKVSLKRKKKGNSFTENHFGYIEYHQFNIHTISCQFFLYKKKARHDMAPRSNALRLFLIYPQLAFEANSKLTSML